MLGSVGKGRSWCWTAVGKHPAAADYIRLGQTSPLLDALAEWVVKGYDELLRSKGRPQQIYSWRFWLHGVNKGTLICGLGRDSSDRIGRPFPLLLMGEGPIKGWEKSWSMLPAHLDRTWKQLEYIASHRYDDARSLEEEIISLDQPGEIGTDHIGSPLDQKSSLPSEAGACKQELLASGFALVGLNNSSGFNAGMMINQSHAQLRACCKAIPRGVFIGGTPQHTFLAVIEHPLGAADFIRLWTV